MPVSIDLSCDDVNVIVQQPAGRLPAPGSWVAEGLLSHPQHRPPGRRMRGQLDGRAARIQYCLRHPDRNGGPSACGQIYQTEKSVVGVMLWLPPQPSESNTVDDQRTADASLSEIRRRSVRCRIKCGKRQLRCDRTHTVAVRYVAAEHKSSFTFLVTSYSLY